MKKGIKNGYRHIYLSLFINSKRGNLLFQTVKKIDYKFH